jgi:hypothetical protein
LREENVFFGAEIMTTIPPEIIAQVRQQNPQLAALPDEMVAMLIL